jgi:hypothetical protein
MDTAEIEAGGFRSRSLCPQGRLNEPVPVNREQVQTALDTYAPELAQSAHFDILGQVREH